MLGPSTLDSTERLSVICSVSLRISTKSRPTTLMLATLALR